MTGPSQFRYNVNRVTEYTMTDDRMDNPHRPSWARPAAVREARDIPQYKFRPRGQKVA